MTPLRAILFDKDGTLLDYEASWGPINVAAADLAARSDAAGIIATAPAAAAAKDSPIIAAAKKAATEAKR